MSDAMKLSASVRTGSVADIKETIPGVIYGSGFENTSLSVNRSEFEKVFAVSGESGLVSLNLDGKEVPVIIKDLQFDAVKSRVIHVDFFKVNMDKKVNAETTLNFIGEAPAVKAHGGIVVEHLSQVHVECLPADLVQKIDVDISSLKELGDSIYIKDLIVPKGIEITNEAEEIVVHVVEPKKVVEEAPVVAEAAPAAEGATEAKPEEKKEEGGDKK